MFKATNHNTGSTFTGDTAEAVEETVVSATQSHPAKHELNYTIYDGEDNWLVRVIGSTRETPKKKKKENA